MKTIKYTGFFIGMLLLGIPASAQITSLADLDNSKSYTIIRQPDSDAGQNILTAAENGTKVSVSTNISETDDDNWVVYQSPQTGFRYLYNLAYKTFLTNTTDGCTLSGVASPCYLIETSHTGNWLLMNNNMLTGMATENNGILFSKNEDLATDGIAFTLTETTRTINEDELADIKAKVAEAEESIRTTLLEEIQTLLEEAIRMEAMGKSDFAGNYDYADLKTAYEEVSGNPDSYSNEELENLMQRTKASVYPKEGKYYRIFNLARPTTESPLTNTLTITESGSKILSVRTMTEWLPGISQDNPIDNICLFQFYKTGTGNSYILYNPSARIYAGEGKSENQAPPFITLQQNKADAAPYDLVYESNLLFRFESSTQPGVYITANGESNCVSFDKQEDPEKWYFQEIKSIDVPVGNSGYATLCLPCAIELPDELEAYVAVKQQDQTLYVQKLADYTGNNILPAYQPVILKRQDDCSTTRFTCPIVYDAPQTDIPNLLQGVTLRSAIAEGSYILYQGKQGIGFYLVDPDDRTLNPNKAYLPYSDSYTSNALRFDFDDMTTSVTIPETNGEQDEILYDLSGRRVSTPIKGVYITRNGKKRIVR